LTVNEAKKEGHHLVGECTDIDQYYSSLAEDIRAITKVKSVIEKESIFIIEVEDGVTQSALKSAMKPLFSGMRFSVYRFVSLELI